MNLFYRFKKDYFNYLVSIIIPVIITAVAIPLFKRILGAEKYGNFSIIFNSVLLCTAVLSGWIWPSAIRYFSASRHKKSFVAQSLKISIITQLVFLLPVFGVVWYLKNDIPLAIFFALALFITSLQFSILGLSQSVFLSKKSIYSELIRSVIYLIVALVLLKVSSMFYMYALFIAVLISYAGSFFYLLLQTNRKLKYDYIDDGEEEKMSVMSKRFFYYGAPLSLWYVFASLITLADKFFMLKLISAEAQGNYQVIFDFLSKSITVFISPVTISLLPLLVSAYQDRKKTEIRRLLLIILSLEFAGLIIACILYWLFGADILFWIIDVPQSAEYKLMGLIIIAATFIFQMAVVVHKKFELQFRSKRLLLLIAVAFVLQLVFYYLFRSSAIKIVFPLGYLLATAAYLFLVSFNEAKAAIKKRLE